MQQGPQQTSSILHLSLQVEQIAITYQLGTPDAEYRTKDERVISFAGLIWMIYILVLISAFFFFFISGADKTWWVWIIWLFFILIAFLAIRLFLGILFLPRLTIFVCPAGLVYRKKDTLEAIRWDQVEIYWKDISISHDGETSDTYCYSLQRNDGAKFEFPDSIVQIQELGKLIEQKVSDHLLPRTIATYHTGATVAFGTITINQQEISVKNGRKILAWNDFENFIAGEEKLAFYQKSHESVWHQQRIAQVANPKVLQGLIDHVAQERVHQQLPQVIATYSTGSPVVFGRITVSLQGIMVDNKQPTLSWNDVSDVNFDMNRRRVSIGSHNKLLDWQTLRTWTTPNTYLLKGLVDYALQKHHQQREAQVLNQLPQTIATYSAGLPLTFGRISLSLQGITVDNGKQSLPWNEVSRIYIGTYFGGKRLTIAKKGSMLAWQTLPISQLGDIEMLQRMIEHIMQGYP